MVTKHDDFMKMYKKASPPFVHNLTHFFLPKNLQPKFSFTPHFQKNFTESTVFLLRKHAISRHGIIQIKVTR